MSGKLERVTNVAIITACVAVTALAIQRLWESSASTVRTADPAAIVDIRKDNVVIPLMEAASAGRHTSKVVVLEFSDFECPYCGQHARQVFPKIKQDFVDKGLIKYVFKNLPLPMHPLAMNAAVAAECALDQDRYWEMHDRLFVNQKQFESSQLLNYAADLGLNTVTFNACLEGVMKDKIYAQMREASRLKVTSTPSFFIGIQDGDKLTALKRITGALPYEVFAQVVNETIKSSIKGAVNGQVGS